MNRRQAFAALAGVTVLATTAGVLLVSAADADRGSLHLTGHQDIGLTVIPCDTCTLNSFGFDAGAHIGEFLVNHGTLTDSKGATVGHYAVHLVGTTVASDGPPEVFLTGALLLADGQIVVQGIESPPAEGGTVSVTGGTGRYRTACGELTFRDLDETTVDMEVILK